MGLFKATRAYCEQIYMLYSDPAFTAEKLIFGATSPNGFDDDAADLSITDDTTSSIASGSSPTPIINLIVTAMADKKLIIADGHHRYETSVAYAKERSAQLGSPSTSPVTKRKFSHRHCPSQPSRSRHDDDFVNMDAPGITILPTHRVVHGLKGFSSPDFIASASHYFDVEEISRLLHRRSTSSSASPKPRAPPSSPPPATAIPPHPKTEVIAEALKDIPARQRQLDVIQLHRIVLDKLLGLDQETITRLGSIKYLREAAEAVALVESGEADIAFLIKPITLDQLKDVSLSGDVMPQKSTDFYPKLLSGLAIYALD